MEGTLWNGDVAEADLQERSGYEEMEFKEHCIKSLTDAVLDAHTVMTVVDILGIVHTTLKGE